MNLPKWADVCEWSFPNQPNHFQDLATWWPGFFTGFFFHTFKPLERRPGPMFKKVNGHPSGAKTRSLSSISHHPREPARFLCFQLSQTCKHWKGHPKVNQLVLKVGLYDYLIPHSNSSRKSQPVHAIGLGYIICIYLLPENWLISDLLFTAWHVSKRQSATLRSPLGYLPFFVLVLCKSIGYLLHTYIYSQQV